MSTRLAKLLKLLESEPTDAFVLYGLAQEHAKGAADGDGHERAIEYYDRCLAADPNYCYAYFHKAVSLQTLGRIDDARATLTAGVEVARGTGDGKALSEISSLLASLQA